MGCAASSEMDELDPFYESKKTNDAIEHLLAGNKGGKKNQVKLLLLGTGESGKSTVLKQMRLLHHNGFSNQERAQYAQVIWADAIQSMKILIMQARTLGISLSCDEPGSKLNVFKQIVLKYNALEHIDTGAAGGSDFLNDYVVKYSKKSEYRRKIQSTGKLGVAPWEEDLPNPSDNGQDAIIENIEEGLNETTDIGPGVTAFIFPNKNTKLVTKSISVTREQIAESIKQLWNNDKGIQQCFLRSNEFQLEGSAAYYFDNIDKFASSDYVCTDEDILKGRIKTTGISETNFDINGYRFKVLDAGGQRSERSKWIHCFEDITAVLFVLAISEYDQKLFEDRSVNRMHEAMHLFNQLRNSRWFYDVPFILFVNKMDLFEKKLSHSPLVKYFPEYQGDPTDVEAATKFFENCFISMNKTNKPIYIHRTCATDTQSMKFVLTAITDMIIQQNLKKSVEGGGNAAKSITPVSTGPATIGTPDSVLASFTTLGDYKHVCGNVLNKSAVLQERQEFFNITPPTSDRNQDLSSPGSVSNSKSISRNEFVDSLINAASLLLELTFSSHHFFNNNDNNEKIQWFLKETLRRSKSSYCTLQIALYYIYKLKSKITENKLKDCLVFTCPKRLFLTSLILSSKFLQDKNYSLKTWSKLSGLPLKELIKNEFIILKALNYELNIDISVYAEWSRLLLVCTYVNDISKSSSANSETLQLQLQNNVTGSISKKLSSSLSLSSHISHDSSSSSFKENLATLSKKRQLAQIFSNFDKKRLEFSKIHQEKIGENDICNDKSCYLKSLVPAKHFTTSVVSDSHSSFDKVIVINATNNRKRRLECDDNDKSRFSKVIRI
ncbi:hypothetical protein PACTADRAFT_3707 [Pachysolen tannophilus NRRL Y-2460]|uniref:Guanine nucleotide-binding protein subunit alpha n=1 Tax=Pachysolen tannophilus NRRL Y-2460 TaxID=669874 RepID=A0A1E4TSV5_PACTA|nr:hypothetical protein PACTADRAFT_3707 [Pachysolen tannophilus NRRL Y-2460]